MKQELEAMFPELEVAPPEYIIVRGGVAADERSGEDGT